MTLMILKDTLAAFKTKLSSLVGNTPTPPSEPEMEHEVYLASRWDPSTGFAPVLYTGTQAACELFLKEEDPRPNCLRNEARIRPTGRSTESSDS